MKPLVSVFDGLKYSKFLWRFWLSLILFGVFLDRNQKWVWWSFHGNDMEDYDDDDEDSWSFFRCFMNRTLNKLKLVNLNMRVRENSEINPILLRFGVALAFSLAGFLFSRFRTRRIKPSITTLPSDHPSGFVSA